MKKALNLENLNSAMERAGFTQTALAGKLGVTKEAVSKWLSGNKFPRPDKLLRLALTLDLGIDEMVIRQPDSAEPVIAFRKRGANKTTALHIEHAKDIGRLLSSLVPFLPYDLLVQPATLKNPSLDYRYIQKVAAKIRAETGVGPEDELDFAHLIKKFNDLQAVIVPVLWGQKDKHENALHIYLPDSMTTWVYLNLDVEIHDFKFWMAHELGHVYTPDMRGNDAEDFADTLAGALIFPESLAEGAYHDVSRSRTEKSQIAKIRKYADCHSISLISIYYEINKYAKHHELAEIELSNNLFAANTNFNKRHLTVSQTIFDSTEPESSNYIRASNEIFDTPLFAVLQSFLKETGKSAGFIQSILDIPLLDAKGIHAELS
jgi:transcriptional regulator with XRE-family HTH domain